MQSFLGKRRGSRRCNTQRVRQLVEHSGCEATANRCDSPCKCPWPYLTNSSLHPQGMYSTSGSPFRRRPHCHVLRETGKGTEPCRLEQKGDGNGDGDERGAISTACTQRNASVSEKKLQQRQRWVTRLRRQWRHVIRMQRRNVPGQAFSAMRSSNQRKPE